MPMTRTITASTKVKATGKLLEKSRPVEFNTMSEAFALLKDGKFPKPFKSREHFFRCAIGRVDVEIQNDLRDELLGKDENGSGPENPLYK